MVSAESVSGRDDIDVPSIDQIRIEKKKRREMTNRRFNHGIMEICSGTVERGLPMRSLLGFDNYSFLLTISATKMLVL